MTESLWRDSTSRESSCSAPVNCWLWPAGCLLAPTRNAKPGSASNRSDHLGCLRRCFDQASQFGPGGMVSWDFVPDGFMAKNVTLRMPIQRAYGVEDYQISRGVKWLSSDAYNIEAKVDASVAERLRKVTREQRRIEQQPRLQHLLAERWKLELHHETKELPRCMRLSLQRAVSKCKRQSLAIPMRTQSRAEAM